MRPIRLTIATALISVLFVSALVGPAAAAHHKHKHKTPTQLAQELSRASTQSARIKALHDIFRVIGLGVRNAHLKIVVPGGEKRKSDIYLYDAEVALLADRLGHHARASFDDMARQLGIDGIGTADPNCPACPPPIPVPGSKLQGVVMQAERESLRGSGPAAIYGQIIRALGRVRGSDLSQPVGAKAAVIDPLQQTLITLGLFEAVKPAPYAQRPSALRNSAMHRSAVHTAGGPCTFEEGNTAASATAAAKSWASRVPEVGAWIDLLTQFTDEIHATILAKDVKVSSASPSQVTGQFGQHGQDSAKPMEFRVLVEMLDQLPENVINCGALAGYTFPDKGPIPNIKVDWKTGSYGFTSGTGYNLLDFGQLTCSGSASCTTTTTDADGISKLTFKPDDEYLPGTGAVFHGTGAVSASALTLSSTGNGLGNSVEGFLGATKGVAIGWDVSWHQPRGYAIDVPQIAYTQSYNGGDSEAFKVAYHGQEVCLGDEYTLLPNPTDPPENAIGFNGIGYDAVGAASDSNSPAFGYYTGTDTYYYSTGGSDEYPLDTRTYGNGQSVPLPLQGIGPGQHVPLAVPNAGQPSDAVGDLTWSGGHAQTQLTLNVKGDPQPSPDTFNFTLPWREATDCPIPKLPPPDG